MTVAEGIREVHGWCPHCDGNGMVMEYGPTDCPNLNLHRMLERLKDGPELLSRWEAAAMLGISIPTLNKLLDAKLIPHQTVGRTYVFYRHDVEDMKDRLKAIAHG